MAVFQEPEDFQRLDYELLLNGSITLYFRPDYLAEDASWLKAHDYRLDSFDCSAWDSEETMYEALATTLEFPEYFGRNLDAVNDCLSDIEVSEDGGRAFIFHRYDVFAAKMPKVAWQLLNIVQNNSWHFLLLGRRLMTLVQSNDPGIRFEPVGVIHVSWNRREWVDKSRGL